MSILSSTQIDSLLIEETEAKFGYNPLTLSYGSKKKILHKCDVCGKIKESVFREFVQEMYLSHIKCGYYKRAQNHLNRHGVENPSQLPEIKEKKKKTCLKNWGTTSPFRSSKIRKKIKQTNTEKYGVSNVMLSPKIKKKQQQTMLEKYDVINPSQSLNLQEKKKQTNLERYGVEWSTQCPVFREKAKQTNLKKYGTEYASQSLEVKRKMRQTNLIRGHHWTQQRAFEFVKESGYSLLEWGGSTEHKSKYQCPKGHTYRAKFNDFQQGHRCPKCLYKNQEKLGQLLEEIHPNKVKSQGNLGFLERQKADFYIEEDKVAIEYDGQQHYDPLPGAFGTKTLKEAEQRLKETQERDKKKERLCQENGWRLIRIRYDEPLTLEHVKKRIEGKSRRILEIADYYKDKKIIYKTVRA